MRKNSCFTRTLSVFLSILMAFSCVSLLRGPIIAFAENFTSVTDAQWNELATALASDNVKNAVFVTSNNNTTADDPSGAVTRAAKAYFAVLNAMILKVSGTSGSESEYNNTSYRTSQQVRDTIKTEMQKNNRMGSNYNAYNASAVIDKLGGPTVSGGNQSGGNGNLSAPSFSVKVTNYGAITSYADIEDAASVPTYTYSVSHAKNRTYSVTSGSGCNQTTTTYYYVVCTEASGSDGSVSRDITSLRNYRDALNNNADFLNRTILENIEYTYDELNDVYTEVTNAKATAVSVFGAPAVAHFFSSWDEKIANLNAAMLICQYKPQVDEINGYIDADISYYNAASDLTQTDLETITGLYDTFKEKYNAYLGLNIPEVYAFFEEDNDILDRAVAEARLEDYKDAFEVTHLKVVEYPAITADVAEFDAYDDDWVLATDNASSYIEIAINKLNSRKTQLSAYETENIDAVFGAGYVADVIDVLITKLYGLYPYDEYKNDFAQYRSVYNDAFEPVTPEYTDAQLYNVLNAKDAWYTQLQAFAAAVEAFDAEYAAKLLGTLEAAMEAKIDSVYAMLNSRVSNTVLTAYDMYQNFVSRYGREVTNADDITMENYRDLRLAFNTVSDQHYLFLDETVHSTLSDEVKEKYTAIRSAVIIFKDYQANLGTADYLFESSEIGDYIRRVSEMDVARNADYTVTDPNVEALINMLDGVLNSDELKETFDLGGTLSGVLDGLYTDDFINTLVQYVYPMVALEFAKVWADLPSSVPITDPVSMTVNLSIQPMGTALENIKLYILPNLLAKNVQTDYPDAYAKLNAVSSNYSLKTDENGDLTWNINPWQDANIYDPETEKLTIEWGVTDKESFLNAATAALSGVAPLLLALLSNQTANIGGQKIGTGSGRACGFVNVTVDPITLKLTFEGNPGYNNALAPILAALGAENIPDGNDLDTVAKVLDLGIITPFESILNKLAAAPIDFLTNVLPSLAFALNLGLVQPLLSELKTQISYSADAHYSSSVQSGDLEGALQDSLTVNIGEMLDLADMGIDITSLNGLLNSIIGLLSKSDEDAEEGEEEVPALSLPAIDSVKLAALTTGVSWSPSYRTVSPFSNVPGHATDFAHLNANRADVFLFILDWFVTGMELDEEDIANGKKDILTQILDLINSMKEEEEADVPGEGEVDEPADPPTEPAEPSEGDEEEGALPEIVQTIINNFVTNYTDSVAAIVELVFPQRYSMESVKKIDWITEGNIGAGDYTTFWTEEYSEYTKTDWTRKDALYVEEHLEEALNNLVKFLSDTDTLGGAQNIGEAIEYLASSLITADTANSLVETISNLLGGLELPDIANDLLAQIGLDASAWDGMTFDFEAGDLDAFKAAIIDILTPVQPLLGFLLAEQDISISLFDSLDVTALGYDGYSYGLVPLLEALGATGLKSTAAFIGDTENIVKNVVDPLFSIIDQLIESPMTFIKKVIPSIVYFDKVGGIKTVIDNLMFAVNVLLDTIRPIYPLNLDTLITADAGIQLPSLEDDLLDFVIETVIGILEEKFEVHLTIDYTIETLIESLHFTDPVSFDSANGSTAYTIELTAEGQAELLVRILDYLIEQIAYDENYDKIAGLLTDLVEDETAQGILQTVLDNLINNYPDSVLAVFKLMYPRIDDRMDAALTVLQSIDWSTAKHDGAADYWTVEEPEYVAGKTPWTQEKGEFMTNHLTDVVENVLKMVGDTDDPVEAVNGLLAKVITAENANKIVDAVTGLLDNLDLPDIVKDLGALQQLGLDKANWEHLNYTFDDGDVDAFKAALIEILDPLQPVLAFLLAEGDLEVLLKDALPIRGLGYDGYSYGIVPILEALGADGVKGTEEFKADPENVAANIIDPLFTVIDHLAEDPIGFIDSIVPELLYFDDVKVLSAAIPNLLFSVTVLLDTIQPLYEVDLYELVAQLTATEENPAGFDLTMSDFSITETLLGLIPGLLGDKLGLDLDEIDLDELKSRLTYAPVAFDSANGDTAYRAVLAEESKAVLFTSALDYVIRQLEKEDNVEAIKELLAGLGLDESASAIVDQVIDNVVNHYTDSVFAVFQIMYPRVVDREDAELRAIQVIEWITDGHFAADGYWTVEEPEYIAGKTPWTEEKGVFMDKHLPDVVQNVLALVSDSDDPSAALGEMINKLFTAENANKIAAAISDLLGRIELPEALNELGVLEQLGLDKATWDGMSFSFEDGNRDAFKAALIQILNPIQPLLAFLLAEGTLTVANPGADPAYGEPGDLQVLVKDALPIRALGYDGYSYGIVPILEALGADGVKSSAEFKAQKNLVVKNIVDPLFTVIDHLCADPIGFIAKVLPELFYADTVEMLQAAVPNILFSVTVLLDTIQPLYDIDLYELVAELTATDENPAGFDLTLSDFNLTETLFGLIPGLASNALGLDLDEIDTEELDSRLSYVPVAFDSANGDTAYRAVLVGDSRAVLLTSALDYAIRQLEKDSNIAVLKDMLSGLGLDESTSAVVDEVIDNLINNYTDSVFAVFQLMYPRVKDRKEADLETIQFIDWITSGNVGADEEYIGTALPEGETTLWTPEKAVYMAEHLGDFLNDIVVIFGEQLGGAETVDDAVSFLVKDIFTAENANAIAQALAGFVNNLGLPAAVKDLGILEQLGLDPAYWEGLNFSFAAGDRTAFKNALITILDPLEPVLAFLLADATLEPLDDLGDPPYGAKGNLEVKVKDALPIRGLGYDGYSYGIVPILEALGASGVKTTAAFKADKTHVVENIVNPLFTVVDHLIANPVKFLEDVLPSVLYFDKVGGIQVAAENLLFSVNVLIDTIQPLYEIDLYELVEEKTGVDLTFSDVSPVDFIIEKVTDVLYEKTGIELNLGTAEELSEELHFTDPIRFASANGDDAYTVKLTDQGKADLLSRILDYGINQVIFEDNFEKLSEILHSLIKDDDTRAIALGVLRIMKDADKDIADFHGVHDVALASLFWVFFGADSVTDATADFFYRYKDYNFYEIVFSMMDLGPAYLERAGFLLKEVYTVEYPAFQKIIEERQALLKPPYEYTEEETQMAAGIGARIIRFFALIIAFFKNLFKR